MTAIADPYLAQRRANLRRANDVRFERVRILGHSKERISRERAAEILGDVPEALHTMKVGVFLGHVWRFGPVHVRKTLGRLNISESKPLGGLTDRQRQVFADYLRSDRP